LPRAVLAFTDRTGRRRKERLAAVPLEPAAERAALPRALAAVYDCAASYEG